MSKDNKNANKFVAKLGLSSNGDTGPFRRIGFPKFIGSHKRLCEAAAELAAADSPETRVVSYKLRLTFKDEDGDSCLVLNDSDVKMAFSDRDKPLKVFAEILDLSVVSANPPCVASPEVTQPTIARMESESASSPGTNENRSSAVLEAVTTRSPNITEASDNSSGRNPPGLHHAVESIVGVLANAVIGLQASLPEESTSNNGNADNDVATTPVGSSGNVNRSASEPEAFGSPEEEPTEEVQELEDSQERPIIHGRHTCDGCLTTPIVGKRFHAVNLPDYDLCQNCRDSYKGDAIVFEEVFLERDLPMQDRWHRRYAKWGTTGRPHPRKHGRRGGPFGPRGRCGQRGFGPPHFHHGPPHHGPPHGPPHLNPHGPPHVHPPHPHAEVPFPSAPQEDTRYANVEDVDAALKEAIRRSMEDMKDSETQTEAKQTNNEGVQTEEPEPEIVVEELKPEARVGEEPEIIVEAQVKSAPASVASSSSSKSVPSKAKSVPSTIPTKDDSFALDAAGNGDVAAVLGETMDKIAFAIQEMNVELERETSQGTKDDNDTDSEEDTEKDSKTKVVVETVDEVNDMEGAVIIDGDHEESKDDASSQNSWDVVEDQVAHDESLARAAFEIGSALFNSGMSESRANSNTNANANTSVASIDSVPTTLPSLSSEAPVPSALLERWSTQLYQMHQLGFYNDALIVETLERLQAANIGSGETDEITVTRVVNEMMKDW